MTSFKPDDEIYILESLIPSPTGTAPSFIPGHQLTTASQPGNHLDPQLSFPSASAFTEEQRTAPLLLSSLEISSPPPLNLATTWTVSSPSHRHLPSLKSKEPDLDEETFGGVLTNRPLNDDEMFEVRIDRIIIKYKDSLGIGVSQDTPAGMDYLDWLVCGTIMLYDHHLYEPGNIYKRRYGTNLGTLRVGDRIDVMRKSNGNLHFFMNGEDQGIAKSNMTYPVYGALDLYGRYVQVSIISKMFYP